MFANLLIVIVSSTKFLAEVSRHGGRAPEVFYPFNIKYWNASDLGQLTPQGMRQHYLIGQQLRYKYIEQEKFLSPFYEPSEIVVVSSYYNRTVESAISQLQGLYPFGTGPALDLALESRPPIEVHNLEVIEQQLGTSALPDSMRVIPVTTIPYEEDFIFRAYKGSVCDKENDEQKDAESTDEYQEKEKNWQNTVFPTISSILGVKIDSIHTAHEVAKELECGYFAGKGTHGLSIDLYNTMVEIQNFYRTYVPFSVPKGRKLACSAFYNDLLAKMTAVTQGESTLKFAFYSGHDGSIISYLSCLDNTPTVNPPFASTLFYEITDNNNLVITYNDVVIEWNGCTTNCSFDDFKDYIEDQIYAPGEVEGKCS